MAPHAPKTREVLAPTQQQTPAPPPSKANLRAWWRQFTTVQKFAKKEGDSPEKRRCTCCRCHAETVPIMHTASQHNIQSLVSRCEKASTTPACKFRPRTPTVNCMYGAISQLLWQNGMSLVCVTVLALLFILAT